MQKKIYYWCVVMIKKEGGEMCYFVAMINKVSIILNDFMNYNF